MKFSLISTTQGKRLFELDRFFTSLENQTYQNFELIFIDQSNNDEILMSIRKSDFFDKTKIIKSDRISISKARNIGLQQATGDIICFPDDDCWYNKDLLITMFNKFSANEEVVCYCTNVYDPISDRLYGKRRARLKNDKKVNLINTFKYPISVGIFVKSEKLNNILFDEELGAGSLFGSGEETDMMYKLLKKKHKVIYTSDIYVYHEVPSDNTWDLNKYFNYGRGFGATIKKGILRKQYLILIEFFNIYFRSLFAMFVFYLFNKKKYKNYYYRISGMIEGLKYK